MRLESLSASKRGETGAGRHGLSCGIARQAPRLSVDDCETRNNSLTVRKDGTPGGKATSSRYESKPQSSRLVLGITAGRQTSLIEGK